MGVTIVLRHAHSHPLRRKPQAASTTHIVHIRQSDGQPMLCDSAAECVGTLPKECFPANVGAPASVFELMQLPTNVLEVCKQLQCATQQVYCMHCIIVPVYKEACLTPGAVLPVRGPVAMHLLACY